MTGNTPPTPDAQLEATVVVIGGGQAGLSAAFHLQRRGFVPAPAPAGERSYVVLDAEDAPGGAWRHRWDSLTMATVNGIFDLPNFPAPEVSPATPSNRAIPDYFAAFEEHFDLHILRPVKVDSVSDAGVATPAETPGPQASPTPGFVIRTNSGTWRAQFVINATGTWTRPAWPRYPGAETFAGRQLHTHDYTSAEEFAGQRVVIVGAGISATQLLEEISRVADTLWVTRAPLEWVDPPSQAQLRENLERVEERTRAGLKPTSIIRVTGLYDTPWIKRARDRGVLVRHPMFTQIEPDGVRMPDGRLEPADAILWATGFNPELRHLAPLKLRTKEGGVRVANGRALDREGLFIIGYGASQSTVGANRAGRDAVRDIVAALRGQD